MRLDNSIRPIRLVLAFAFAFQFAAFGALAGPVAEQLQLRLDAADAEASAGDPDVDLGAVRDFYLGRAFRPLWIDEDGATLAARIFAARLAASESDGLYPVDYDAGFFAENLEATGPAERADLEFKLSRALLAYGRDLSAGRVDPARVDSELHIRPSAVPAEELFAAAEGVDFAAYLSALAPQSVNYARLKAALADYRRLAGRGGWGRVPDGETLKPGMRDAAIPALRRRLAAGGDLAQDAIASEAYDETLEEAVRRFQRRHGLDVDGAVGKMTRKALNVPVTARIEQMLLNMERRRWMPDDLGRSYVFVNMADFVLKYVVGPKTYLDTRVVIGKPYHRTPVFSDRMRYIVINPYWTVPPSIARKEILPKLKKNANYLAEKNIKLFSGWNASAAVLDATTIDWSAVSPRGFGYRLRQEPGKGNALGTLKFMFPNRFNVYLHDTPARSLFKKAVRSFSHGCIRVENPDEFAAMLLRDHEGWSREEIQAAIASGKRQVVTLKTSIPVHLTYLTAWVNKDASVYFRDDIYDRDKRLRKALDHLQRPL